MIWLIFALMTVCGWGPVCWSFVLGIVVAALGGRLVTLFRPGS